MTLPGTLVVAVQPLVLFWMSVLPEKWTLRRDDHARIWSPRPICR